MCRAEEGWMLCVLFILVHLFDKYDLMHELDMRKERCD